MIFISVLNHRGANLAFCWGNPSAIHDLGYPHHGLLSFPVLGLLYADKRAL